MSPGRRPLPLAALAAAAAVTATAVAGPQTLGRWEGPYQWPVVDGFELIATHLIHLPTGEILVLPQDYSHGQVGEPAEIVTWLVDITGGCLDKDWVDGDGCFTPLPNPSNLFCAGHAQLANGDALVVGGHLGNHMGLPDTYVFASGGEDPWQRVDDMQLSRWYPTITALPDGKLLGFSGTNHVCADGPRKGEDCAGHNHCHGGDSPGKDCDSDFDRPGGGTCGNDDCGDDILCEHIIVEEPELFDPQAGEWTLFDQAPLATGFYPFLFVWPTDDGTIRVVFAGSEVDGLARGQQCQDSDTYCGRQAWTFDVDNVSWSKLGAVGKIRGSSAVMYELGKILRSGGRTSNGVTDVAEAIDLGADKPDWTEVDSMTRRRYRHNLTLLPDGTVLATGGAERTNRQPCCEEPVKVAELFDPDASPQWRLLAEYEGQRTYHSTAMLLPDGRVLSAGGEHSGGTAEIYYPPYLCQESAACNPSNRPVISAAPAAFHYADLYDIETPDAGRTDKVTLLALAAVTHAFDSNQRRLDLSFTKAAGRVTVRSPDNPTHAPPGYYMLFLVDDDGVPSVARYVRVMLPPVGTWVDFDFPLPAQFGSFFFPFDTFAEGVAAVPVGQMIRVKPGTTDETALIDKRLYLGGYGGSAVIGQP